MHHHFTAEQWLPYPLEVVFRFFADPANLPPLMPAWQRARIERSQIVAPPSQPPNPSYGMVAGAGTTMRISFRLLPLLPVRQLWDAEIVEFAWNDHFCDVQHSGPFRFWRHCHRLSAESRNGEAGTLLRDEVEYELPGGALGDLATRLGGTLQFRYIFGVRHRQTARLLPGYLAARNGSAQG